MAGGLYSKAFHGHTFFACCVLEMHKSSISTDLFTCLNVFWCEETSFINYVTLNMWGRFSMRYSTTLKSPYAFRTCWGHGSINEYEDDILLIKHYKELVGLMIRQPFWFWFCINKTLPEGTCYINTDWYNIGAIVCHSKIEMICSCRLFPFVN